MKHCWLFTLMLLVGSLWPVDAQSSDSEYVNIYQLIQAGDSLRDQNQAQEALVKYRQARGALKKFQAEKPNWNPSVLKFRLNYLEQQVAALESETPPEPSVEELQRTIETAGVSKETLDALKRRVELLESEKSLLEARLIESLKARPAAVDPRELASAEDRIEQLVKEKELLKVQLETAEKKVQDLSTRVGTEKALSDANQKSDEQANQIAMLHLEKEALQRHLTEIQKARINERAGAAKSDETPRVQTTPTAEEERIQTALEDAAERIAQYERELEELKNIRQRLEARIRSLEQENQSLHQENQQLLAELSRLKTDLESSLNVEALRQKLDEARAQLEAAQAQNKSLRGKVETLSSRSAESMELRKELERKSQEIEQLEVRLQALEAQLAKTNEKLERSDSRKHRSKVVSLNNEIVLLESRLEVLEAQQVPYTEEELALFQEPEQNTAEESNPGPAEPVNSRRAGMNSLPAGASQLLMEAERAFTAGRLEEAETKYRQILLLDETNVFTLSNLAAIQMERDNLDEAETNLRQALEQAPQHARSLTLLGIIKFRQKQFDEALDLLSQAADIDPTNPETQTYLGITLSQKGLRSPAEQALRKAVQLAPGYPNAHYNLAVVYATQTPPFPELANWHYQRALYSGHSRNEELEKLIRE